jgi:hypothetical protein
MMRVPIAISAISQDDLAKRGITSTAQLTGTIPRCRSTAPMAIPAEFHHSRHRRRQ